VVRLLASGFTVGVTIDDITALLIDALVSDTAASNWTDRLPLASCGTTAPDPLLTGWS